MLTRIARGVRNRLRTVYRTVRNRRKIDALQHDRSLRVHLGCGDDRLPGFVNIDCRPTGAVDVAMDLSLPRLADGSVSFVFSNAFFEHLYRPARGPHLQRIRRALVAEGACCYIGIPYFPNIARLYVERGPGTAGPVFDLYNVYRYTHGDPEGQAAWWLGQLHKSLFDEDEVAGLLAQSGFASAVMFCYSYPGEPDGVRVTMGFYATAAAVAPAELRQQCLAFLQAFADARIRLATLEWLLPRAE